MSNKAKITILGVLMVITACMARLFLDMNYRISTTEQNLKSIEMQAIPVTVVATPTVNLTPTVTPVKKPLIKVGSSSAAVMTK